MFLIAAIFAAIVGVGVYTAEKPNPFAYTKIQRARLAHSMHSPLDPVDPREQKFTICVIEQLELRVPYEVVVGPNTAVRNLAIKDAVIVCGRKAMLEPVSPDADEVPAADPEAPSV